MTLANDVGAMKPLDIAIEMSLVCVSNLCSTTSPSKHKDQHSRLHCSIPVYTKRKNRKNHAVLRFQNRRNRHPGMKIHVP